MTERAASHLVALSAGWGLWRWVGLRAAGFPADCVLSLATSESAALADRLIEIEDAARSAAKTHLRDELQRASGHEERRVRKALVRLERDVDALPELPADHPETAKAALSLRAPAIEAQREALRRTFAVETSRMRTRLRELARDPLFCEAVIWQNRAGFHRAVTSLARTPAEPAGSRRVRRDELLVARYVQRYAMKNEMIGFFGPLGWARLVDSGPPVRAEPGATLLATRSVYFEQWGIDAVARKLSEDAALRPWLAPRLMPFLRLEGARLIVPFRDPVELPPAQARILAACDGQRSARAIAAELVDAAVAGSEDEVFGMLDFARQMGAVAWAVETPLELHPERTLRSILEGVGDDAARERALAALGEYVGAKDDVARAAGDPVALDRAMGNLETTFMKLTGETPTRLAGQIYAGRTLVYEDCRRDIQVEIGPEVVRRLAAPLSLILRSARWYTFEVARRYRVLLESLYRRLSERTGERVIELTLFQAELMKDPELAGADRTTPSAALVELRRRWSELLGLPSAERSIGFSSDELASRAALLFDAPGPGWTEVRHVSPDILIRTADVAAFRRGEFELVLGEVHVHNTLRASPLFAQHPAPEELVNAMAEDVRETCVVLALPKERFPQRADLTLNPPGAWRFTFSTDPPPRPHSRNLRVADLAVWPGARGLEVRSRDGVHRFDTIDFIGTFLAKQHSSFDIVGPFDHCPRVAIDQLIVCRERWTVPVAGLRFPRIDDPMARFVAARRWARAQGLPRFVFVKVPTEQKPLFVDLESAISVDLLAQLSRKTEERFPEGAISVTEMLPSPDELWLTDARGYRYTSELRMVALDPQPAALELADDIEG